MSPLELNERASERVTSEPMPRQRGRGHRTKLTQVLSKLVMLSGFQPVGAENVIRDI